MTNLRLGIKLRNLTKEVIILDVKIFLYSSYHTLTPEKNWVWVLGMSLLTIPIMKPRFGGFHTKTHTQNPDTVFSSSLKKLVKNFFENNKN